MSGLNSDLNYVVLRLVLLQGRHGGDSLARVRSRALEKQRFLGHRRLLNRTACLNMYGATLLVLLCSKILPPFGQKCCKM